jgi:hypothetical protein
MQARRDGLLPVFIRIHSFIHSFIHCQIACETDAMFTARAVDGGYLRASVFVCSQHLAQYTNDDCMMTGNPLHIV